MSETYTHTPGPWRAVPGNCGGITGIMAPSGPVAVLGMTDALKPADVALIEAAPDMLGALVMHIDGWRGVRWSDLPPGTRMRRRLESGRRAVARATDSYVCADCEQIVTSVISEGGTADSPNWICTECSLIRAFREAPAGAGRADAYVSGSIDLTGITPEELQQALDRQVAVATQAVQERDYLLDLLRRMVTARDRTAQECIPAGHAAHFAGIWAPLAPALDEFTTPAHTAVETVR